MEIVEVCAEGKPAVAIDGRPLRFPETDDVAVETALEVEPDLSSDKQWTCR